MPEDGGKEEEEGGEMAETGEEDATIFKPKMKLFPGHVGIAGLRIRAQPSFLVCQPVSFVRRACHYPVPTSCVQANPIGVIKPGEFFSYVDEVGQNMCLCWGSLTQHDSCIPHMGSVLCVDRE